MDNPLCAVDAEDAGPRGKTVVPERAPRSAKRAAEDAARKPAFPIISTGTTRRALVFVYLPNGKLTLWVQGLDLFLQFPGNFGGPFGAIMDDRGPSGLRQAAPDGFPDLRRPHESSGAYLGARFLSFSLRSVNDS